MSRISHILVRTAFTIALSGAVIAAASGCGRSNAADTPASEEFSASGSSAGAGATAASGASEIAAEELIPDSADQFSTIFGSTSDFAEDLSDNDQGKAPVSGSGSENALGAADDAAINAPFADLTGNTPSTGSTGGAAEFAAENVDDLGTPAGTVPASANTPGTGTAASNTADALAAAALAASEPVQSKGEKTAAAALDDGLPKRTCTDTALKESVLSAALVECTGWGQSTGSSLHAASAATSILDWSNQVGTGNVDSAALAETVRTEYDMLTPEQRDNLKNNWSFISYDVETMLDSFSDLENTLSDAGCLEMAKAAVADKNVLDNWKATHDALEAAMK